MPPSLAGLGPSSVAALGRSARAAPEQQRTIAAVVRGDAQPTPAGLAPASGATDGHSGSLSHAFERLRTVRLDLGALVERVAHVAGCIDGDGQTYIAELLAPEPHGLASSMHRELDDVARLMGDLHAVSERLARQI